MSYILEDTYIQVLCDKIKCETTNVIISISPPFIKLKLNAAKIFTTRDLFLFESNNLYSIYKTYSDPIGMSEAQTDKIRKAIQNRIGKDNKTYIPSDFYDDLKQEMLDLEIEKQLGGNDEDQGDIKKDEVQAT